jgi:hypothetical protein
MKTPDRFTVLKEIKLPLLIALMGFIGGISGTVVGSFLTAKHAREKDISDVRVTVYNKFFAGQAKLLQVRYGQLSPEKAEQLNREYEQEIKEARFQIGVFGSPEVIGALDNWFKFVESPKKSDEDPRKHDVKIYQAMRREILGDQARHVDDAVLYDLLFKYGKAPVTEQK